MSLLDRLHGGYVYQRRISELSHEIAQLLPSQADVLDVGCGDGLLGSEIARLRPDLHLEGIDVLIRSKTFMPVSRFDGTTIPYSDASIDVVMLVDVLHHTDDPTVLLREAKRVARQAVVIKDHTRDGLLADARLRLMDWVGNARHGVVLPYNYWPRSGWRAELMDLELIEETWNADLHLYPWWANWIFGSSLHFVSRLHPGHSQSTTAVNTGDGEIVCNPVP
jgi:SAM-dependent methyltransferase